MTAQEDFEQLAEHLEESIQLTSDALDEFGKAFSLASIIANNWHDVSLAVYNKEMTPEEAVETMDKLMLGPSLLILEGLREPAIAAYINKWHSHTQEHIASLTKMFDEFKMETE